MMNKRINVKSGFFKKGMVDPWKKKVADLRRSLNKLGVKCDLQKTMEAMQSVKECRYCKTELNHENISLDHIIPKSRGGPNLWVNFQFICFRCNRFKGNLTDGEFFELLAMVKLSDRLDEIMKIRVLFEYPVSDGGRLAHVFRYIESKKVNSL